MNRREFVKTSGIIAMSAIFPAAASGEAIPFETGNDGMLLEFTVADPWRVFVCLNRIVHPFHLACRDFGISELPKQVDHPGIVGIWRHGIDVCVERVKRCKLWAASYVILDRHDCQMECQDPHISKFVDDQNPFGFPSEIGKFERHPAGILAKMTVETHLPFNSIKPFSPSSVCARNVVPHKIVEH